DHEYGTAENSEYKIDIDLGPDMQVSRFHAKIAFDSEEGQWFIFVNGRNGLVLDDRRLERGQKAYLRSGMVIGILGTQMMFLLPNVRAEVHPEIRRQLLMEEDPEEEDDMGEDKAPRSANKGPRSRQTQPAPTGRGQPPTTSRGLKQAAAPASSSQ